MSTLVVEVCEVKAVYPHPNADALEFITVKGWPVIVQKALGLKVADQAQLGQVLWPVIANPQSHLWRRQQSARLVGADVPH